jgi:hypothetical protein
MVKQVWGRHNTVVTGSQGSEQVSKNEWNDDLNRKGLLGFEANTLASASSVTIPDDTSDDASSFIKLSGTTSVDTIVTTNTTEGDLLFVITTGSVTLNNTSSPSSAGDIRLLSNANKDLSTTVPTILMRISDYWYEYGGGITNSLDDIGDVVITSVGNEDVLAYDSTTSKWINQTADESGRVTASSTTTFTNKTIDADGTGNSITNIENANVKASAGIDATKLADGTVTSTELQYINTLSSNAQTQIDSKSATAGNGSLVTVGALDSGSITSGFGNINIGSSTITTTGAVATGAITAGGTISGNLTGNVTGDTSGSSGSCTGNSATVTTNANLTGGVTSVGNASTVITNANLTGSVTSVGNATTVITNANLTGDVTSSGNATTIATDAVDIAMLSATGTASGTTFLCGDNTWKVAGGDDTPWSVVHDFDTYYYDMEIQSKPADPSADNARFYVKEIDSNNDGVFCIIRKNGGFEETQIV